MRFLDDSLIILAEINILVTDNNDIFIRPELDRWLRQEIRDDRQTFSMNNISELSLPKVKFDKLIVKNVGQGSWNEMYSANDVKLVFDFGTHYNTRIPAINNMLGNTENIYQFSKPILVISHWDVDHYHFLKAMSDATISSFSNIICRNYFYSKLSKSMCARIKGLTNKNFFLIDPGPNLMASFSSYLSALGFLGVVFLAFAMYQAGFLQHAVTIA